MRVFALRLLPLAADLCGRPNQVESLAEVVHRSNDNAGVLRQLKRQKSHVNQETKSLLHFDFPYEILTLDACEG